MKRLLLLALPLLLGSCTKKHPGLTPAQNIGCNVETTLTKGAAGAIALTLNCADKDQIQADLMTALGNVNMCKTSSDILSKQNQMMAKGLIGNLICPFAVNTMVGLVSLQIPLNWKCSPQDSVPIELFKKAVTSACEAAIPI